ncbi:MAG: glycosyltransferase family 2 protein [Anaerolineae bacterium]|nr:glycosyltransferase family 2 protein [Caldilineales bacterium]MDW8268130.1 glycosyltransferase family 2 protein [Anaerolineae bacterium]
MKIVRYSVLMPVYNEARTLRAIVAHVRAMADLTLTIVPLASEVPETVRLEQEIIAVDDGSRDESPAILRELATAGELRAFFHAQNQGKGAAIRTAIQHATGEILLIQDADLEYDPRDYPRLLEPILEGRSPVVYGSRFLGGPRKAMYFRHMLGNKLLTLVTNILYDSILTDMETCYKCFRREVLDGVPLRARRFELEPEITAKILKRGYRIYEVPISYAGREYAEGKNITWRDGFPALWALIKYRFVD